MTCIGENNLSFASSNVQKFMPMNWKTANVIQEAKQSEVGWQLSILLVYLPDFRNNKKSTSSELLHKPAEVSAGMVAKVWSGDYSRIKRCFHVAEN